MSKKNKVDTAASARETGTAPVKKPKASKTPASRKAAKDDARDATGFDFVGKVESIAIDDGAGSGTFHFVLRGRHGRRQALLLETGSALALHGMAPIVTAAHVTGGKIGVKVRERGVAVPQVIAVESRPHLGKRARKIAG